jgi:hypothetical protein
MTLNPCTIEWNKLSPQEWELDFARIPRTNLLQSYDYAVAICPIRRMRGRWGLIKIGGQQAGLVQILEAKFLGNLIHALVIDRGPIWFDGFGGDKDCAAFIKSLLDEFPRRIGRRYRLIPEMKENTPVNIQLEKAGFKRQAAVSYKTIWLDLTLGEDELHGNLKKNWRNMLSRAQRSGLQIDWTSNGKTLKLLLENYAVDKAQKGYSGASIQTIIALAKTMLPKGKMLTGHAYKDGKAVASVLLLLHGRSATYQIGWTSGKGRDCGAQNLLLWDALAVLKQRHIMDLDLGGINDSSAKGIQTFKAGMGGRTVTLSGLYIG